MSGTKSKTLTIPDQTPKTNSLTKCVNVELRNYISSCTEYLDLLLIGTMFSKVYVLLKSLWSAKSNQERSSKLSVLPRSLPASEQIRAIYPRASHKKSFATVQTTPWHTNLNSNILQRHRVTCKAWRLIEIFNRKAINGKQVSFEYHHLQNDPGAKCASNDILSTTFRTP